MSALPLLLSLLVASYAVAGLIVLHQASKPTCRVCLFRNLCPNRLRGLSQLTEIPVCLRSGCPEFARAADR
jgi:hypothetical protein